MVDYVWMIYMDVYMWSLTYGSYDGLLMMLENDVNVLTEDIGEA